MMRQNSVQSAMIALAASLVLLSAATQARSPQPTTLDAAAVATSDVGPAWSSKVPASY